MITIMVISNSQLENKSVDIFPNSISLKVNVIARIEFELAYYDVAIQPLKHYATGTSLGKRIVVVLFIS